MTADPATPAPVVPPGRVALVHDWLTGMRGGERVLDALCELYPGAELFTLVHVPGRVAPRIEARRIHTSIVQRFPAAARLYRQYLLAFPVAVELLDLDRFDLVVSTSHCAAKSVIRPGRARHLCYCHTPMRYAWDQFDAYFGPAQMGRAGSAVMRRLMAWMARWDAATAGRVDRYVANSHHVARRIRRYYNRVASVVYPPVDTSFFTPGDRGPRDSFLIVSALVPYKRIDVAIAAANEARLPLRIVGEGPEGPRLRRLAGDTVTFLGRCTDEEIRQLYRESAAFLLPGEEDFGIAPVEAQACGCPVIALARGGATETVTDGESGFLIGESTPAALADAMIAARQRALDPDRVRVSARRFSRERFLTDIARELADLCAGEGDRTGW